MASIRLKTAPTAEPLAVTDTPTAAYNVLDHLRVDVTDDNDLIGQLIVAARVWCEEFTRRAFITQIWELRLDAFPAEIVVPKPRLITVTHVKYTDTSGNVQTFSADDYDVDIYAEPGVIRLGYGQSWPSFRSVPNSVLVEYTAGYGATAANIPGPIIAAMKLLIGHWYEHREDVVIGVTPAEVPFVAKSLLYPYRVLDI